MHEFELQAAHLPGIFNGDVDLLLRWNVNSCTKKQFLLRVMHDNLVDVPVAVTFFQLDSPF